MTQRPEPGFVFMVFHYPEPGHAEALAEGMREMGAVPGEREPRQRFYFTSASPGTSPDHTD
jgi:hypothetical protein